jgi:hypothetical protein
MTAPPIVQVKPRIITPKERAQYEQPIYEISDSDTSNKTDA